MKREKIIIVSLFIALIACSIYFYTLPKVPDNSKRIEELENQLLQREEVTRKEFSEKREQLKDSLETIYLQEKQRTRYYENLYEQARNQDIDSVTARTHKFFDIFEIPKHE